MDLSDKGSDINILLVTTTSEEPVNIWGPSLGLCYISAYMKSKGYKNIKAIDMNVDSEEEFESALQEADIVGVSCFTKTIINSFYVAEKAKQHNSIVVLGGPHPTLCTEEVLQNKNVDFAVISEGEERFYKLIKALSHGHLQEISKIDGIGHKLNGKIQIFNTKTVIPDLDKLPFPDRSIFHLDRYNSRHVTVLASRGCPYKCSNCQPALSILTGKFRVRTVDNVIGELKEIKQKYHTNMISFVDNGLTYKRDWTEEFCNKIVNDHLDLIWQCQGRVNTLDKPLMILMKQAGCDYMGIGIESGSQRVLNDVIHKGMKLERAKMIVDIAKEINLPTHTFFMFGIPGETKKDIEKTIEFASNLNASSIGFSIGTPWPKSGFYMLAKEKGWLRFDKWTDLHEKRYCFIETDEFNTEDIKKYKAEIYQIFKKKGWLAVEKTFQFFNPDFDRSLIRRIAKKITFRFLSIEQIRSIMMFLHIKKSA